MVMLFSSRVSSVWVALGSNCGGSSKFTVGRCADAEAGGVSA